LPLVENAIWNLEKKLGMHAVPYIDYLFAIKRYSYKGSPFDSKILEEIAPEINLDFA